MATETTKKMYPVSYDNEETRQPHALSREVYKRFVSTYETMEQSHPFFQDMSAFEYFEEGRKRFNTYVPKKAENGKEWKTQYRSNISRNKALGIVAHIISQNIQSNIYAQNQDQDEDVEISRFLKDIVTWSQEKEGWRKKLFWAIVTTVAEGTCIVSDEYGEFKREIKDIIDFDPDTGEFKWKGREVTDFQGAYSEIIPNDDFFVHDPFVSDIQDQAWVIRRRRFLYSEATKYYQHYSAWGDVKPGSSKRWGWESDVFRNYDHYADLGAEEVEILEMYDRIEDRMVIVCNGVLLTHEDTPLPREDKKLPFAKAIYEPLDHNFFWGGSLVLKLSDEQDALDTLLRMFIDRAHLKNVPPLVTNNPALVNEDIIIPGLTTFTGGADFEVSTINGVDTGIDGSSFNLYELLQGRMNESSLDPVQQGASPAGGTPTASQILQMSKNAQIVLGLFGDLIGQFISDWTTLRIHNLLWQLKRGQIPVSKITLNDQLLESGKMGKKIYLFEEGLQRLSKKSRQKLSSEIAEIEDMNNNRIEIMAIDPGELYHLSLFVAIDAQPEPKRTDEIQKAMAFEKWNMYSARPDVFNQRSAATKVVQALGDDPDDLIIQEPPAPPPGAMQGAVQGAPPGTQPQRRPGAPQEAVPTARVGVA